MSDQELFEMVAHGADYTPEAFEAGRQELARRNLEPEAVTKFEAVVAVSDVDVSEKAERPLPLILKVINFVLPFGLLQMVIADVYGNSGQLRRQRECWSWMWRGLAFYVLFVLCLLGLDVVDRNVVKVPSGGWVFGLAAIVSLALAVGIPALLPRRQPAAERRAA